jgi:RsmE family RNA methyltransferase
LRLTDRRAAHVRTVLHAGVGQVVRMGQINGNAGRGIVESVDESAVVVRWEPDGCVPSPSRVDLLLALPRPKVMRRLWAPLASMGVGHLVLVNAARVERNYFDTHWLEREVFEPLLLEGLEQSGDTVLPQVSIRRRFRPFVEDELETMFLGNARVVGHPGDADPMTELRLPAAQRILVAVGPEGGWTPFEIELLKSRGFRCVSAGRGTLRSDTACVALLVLAQEVVRRSEKGV